MAKFRYGLLLAASLSLAGCGTWNAVTTNLPSWMGGEKKAKAREPGERIDVLPVDEALKPDAGLKDKPVSLPPVNNNPSWPAHSGMFGADGSNLAGGSFDSLSSATAGDGNSFESTLVISPVVGGGMVYSMDAEGMISARDAADIGNQKWQNKGVANEDENLVIGGGLGYSPEGGGRVFASSGFGKVAAFEASTGKLLWSKELHVPFRSPPVPGAGKIFITTLDNQVYALNANSGEVAWTQRGISETTELMSLVSPAVSGDTVVVPFSSGELYVLSAADGREVWSDSLSARRAPGGALFSGIGGDPVVDNAVVFAVSAGGLFSVKSVANGQPAYELPIATVNTPWLAGDYVFLLTTDNTLVALHKFDGHIRWSTKLKSYEDETKRKDPITWKGPVLVDGKLAVVSSNGELVLVNAGDGLVTATKPIPEGIYTSPVVANGVMYLEGQDATLYSLK